MKPHIHRRQAPAFRHLGPWGAAALLALVVGLPAGGAAAQEVTLEGLMAAPFPSEIVAAPSGDRLAWVLNTRGVRNIWVAEGPDYRARQVTAYDRDDGQEVGSLFFDPAGERVFFVYGGAPNRSGEAPNPVSLVSGTTRGALWVVPFAGGEARKVLDGGSPALSPDGGTIAFTRERGIWTLALDEEAAEAERWASARGGLGSLRWSPDGSRLAFSSARGDHGFIGVLTAGVDSVLWIDPTVDRDGSPVWSPAGDALAFVRRPNMSGTLPFMPIRAGHPWELRVGDPDTGVSRSIWKASEGPGSVFQGVNADNPIFWGAGDHIVFPWEGNGWKTLYSVPVQGGDARALSPGRYEVQFVSMSPDRQHVLFSSNQNDIDRQHVWRAPVEGGGAELLSEGDGIEWMPVMTAGARDVAFLASGPRHPAHPEILAGGERRWLAADAYPADWPADALVTPQQVVFPATDGMSIHGQLFLPAGAAPGDDLPAVLFFHGGSRRQMLLGFHHRGYYHNAYAMNQYLASQGYAVLAVNYRSGTGYGMEFREALNYGATGASEFQDVLGAGLFLQARPEVDPERVGLWGGSYGGYLTAMGLAKASDLFAAGVDLHGVHDWNVGIKNFVPSYEPEAYPEFSRQAFQSSPMNFLDGWRSPVLLIHGDDDRNVQFRETVDLVEALRTRGVEFEQLVFPDEVHGFLLHRNWMAAYRAASDFFDRKLNANGGGGR